MGYLQEVVYAVFAAVRRPGAKNGDWCGAFYLRRQRRRHNGCDVRMQRWMMIILCYFRQGAALAIDRGRLMGDPFTIASINILHIREYS